VEQIMGKNKTAEHPPLDNTELRRRQEMRSRIHAEQTRARAAEKRAQKAADLAASYETIAESWRPSQWRKS
jgi:hypothetical protein